MFNFVLIFFRIITKKTHNQIGLREEKMKTILQMKTKKISEQSKTHYRLYEKVQTLISIISNKRKQKNYHE